MDHTYDMHWPDANDESFFLYKFRKINERLGDSLASRSLYFAKPDTLNDPFDCRIDLQKALQRAESSATGDRKNFLSSVLSNPEFFGNWKSTFDTVGVCCFSRTNEQTLLWSHYADDHKGVCLEYEFRPSYLLTKDFQLTAAGNVEYRVEPLAEWLKYAPMGLDNFVIEMVHKYLKTKSPAWEYEQEARIIRREHGAFKFDGHGVFLNEICFGLRTPQADIDCVSNLVRKYSSCTRFSQMVPDDTEFGFVKRSL